MINQKSKPIPNERCCYPPARTRRPGETYSTPFGLYRPGPELRAVYYAYPEHVLSACRWFRDGHNASLLGEDGQVTDGGVAGCDEPLLLGNDPLYGGLGGSPT